MNKLNVGDYVRTKYGIAKIINLKENPYGEKTIYILDKPIIDIYDCEGGELACINPLIEDMENKFDTYFGDEKCIIKSSPNIIDLIEVGDIVNYGLVGGGMVLHKENDEIITSSLLFNRIKNKDIKTVITKEQIENNMYKVGE